MKLAATILNPRALSGHRLSLILCPCGWSIEEWLELKSGPGGAIVELMASSRSDSLEQKVGQQRFEFLGSRRQKAGPRRRALDRSAQTPWRSTRTRVRPTARAERHLRSGSCRACGRGDARRSSSAPNGRMMERADHRGHIAQRRPLHPPFAERDVRLAFEIDNHEILAGEEQLA